jgi:hypothetical protein
MEHAAKSRWPPRYEQPQSANCQYLLPVTGDLILCTYVGDQDNQENITITLPCDLRLGRRRWHINGHHDPR